MFTYQINYLLNGEEKIFVTNSEEDIKFAIRKRLAYGTNPIFYFILKHDYSKVEDNSLNQLYNVLIADGITQIIISLLNTETNETDELFTYNILNNSRVVELDTEVNIDNLGENNTVMPFETVLRIG